MSSSSVRALIPTGFGINCEAETAHAFELAGAIPDQVHLNDLIEQPALLARCRILALAGGFSFGDHLGAGKVYANRLRRRLADVLARFVDDGGLIIGICNGFQTIARLGLVPAGRIAPQSVALAPNRHGCFFDGWVTLAVDPESPCVFTRGIERLEVPVRHGEGRLVTDQRTLQAIRDRHLAPLRYVAPGADEPTQEFPHNPNGSQDAVAGLCDGSGRVFGLMPHPEAFLFPQNHPTWRRRGGSKQHGDGLQVFVNAVEAARR